jgi:hypothetical protein
MGDFVIWSFEHGAWWMSGGQGYTPYLTRAGRYSRAEAEAIVANANRYRPTPYEAAFAVEAAAGAIPSVTCPACGWTSYNPSDVAERYCGHCHEWHGGANY